MNRFSLRSALVVFAGLPAWVIFWWDQRAWASPQWILVGGPALVALAVWLGVMAWRRREPMGWLATLVAVTVPMGVFVAMNFAGNP